MEPRESEGSYQRPNLIPGVNPCYTGRPQSRMGGATAGAKQYFNVAAFAPAAPYTYGNTPRTVNCYGPGYNNSDLSINKTFSIGDRVKATFRAEALNAFNTPEFGSPLNTLTAPNSPNAATFSTATSQINSQLGFSRIIQMGGRLTF